MTPPSELPPSNTLPNETVTSSNNFNFLTRLPVKFTVLERNNFEIAADPNNSVLNSLRERIRAASPTSGQDNFNENVVSSNTIFWLHPGLFSNAIGGIQPNEKVEQHQLVLNERKTDFYMDQYDSLESVVNAPFVFSFYENLDRYERCYVDVAYLAASMDYTLLQHIRRTHSMRILYNRITLDTYQKKTWYHQDESFCKKIPLKNIDSHVVLFNPLIAGEHPGENVNTTSNLMFSGAFKNKQGVFYRPNRFITCTAFNTQADIQNKAVRSLWLQLEKGFSSPVVLTTYPLVGLIPCFPRGKIVQTTENVVFRGLVSNGGGDDGF